jgi:hypothetical protein
MLKTKKDIKDFFRILAEESVREAKSKIYDDGAAEIMNQAGLDKTAYSKITEEEEVDADVSIDAGMSDDVALDADVEVSDVPEENTQSQDQAEIEDVSLDSIAKKIKIMRSGISVDDTSVQQPLRTYFDLLSDPERKALYAFLNAISAIMVGEVSAENAADPSDPPYNVVMSSSTEEAEEVEDIIDDTDAVVSAEEEVEEEFEEDAEEAVPIRVGNVQESKSIRDIRRRVLDLLKKS